MTEEDDIIAAAPGRRLQVRKMGARRWTGRRRARFLEHLAATCNVRRSAEAVGMSEAGAYQLRMRDEPFRELWAAALEQGYARLEVLLVERASGAVAMPAVEGDLVVVEGDVDAELAINLLRQHGRGLAGIPHGGRRPGKATLEETNEAILKKLKALKKRLDKNGRG